MNPDLRPKKQRRGSPYHTRYNSRQSPKVPKLFVPVGLGQHFPLRPRSNSMVIPSPAASERQPRNYGNSILVIDISAGVAHRSGTLVIGSCKGLLIHVGLRHDLHPSHIPASWPQHLLFLARLLCPFKPDPTSLCLTFLCRGSLSHRHPLSLLANPRSLGGACTPPVPGLIQVGFSLTAQRSPTTRTWKKPNLSRNLVPTTQ